MQKKRTNYNLKPLVALLLLCVAMVATLQAQNAYFSVVGGIPHLPVYAATSNVASPVPGAMIYSTADAAPMFYSGATDGWQPWCTAKPALATGAYTNFTVTAAGLPCLPVSAVATGAAVSGAVYYPSGGTGLLVNNAAAWYTPKNLATNTAPTATSNVTAGNITGYTSGGFALPVLASDPPFVATDKGAVYLNTDKSLHVNNGTAWVSVTCSNCPASVTGTCDGTSKCPNYTSTTFTIVYGVVDVPTTSSTGACWTTQNLGATKQPTSWTDATWQTYGYYYRWGDPVGLYYIAVGIQYSSSWSWQGVNMVWAQWSQAGSDPCTLQLGSGWHIPTYPEWVNCNTAYATYNTQALLGASALHLSSSGGAYTNSSSTLTFYSSQGAYCISTTNDGTASQTANNPGVTLGAGSNPWTGWHQGWRAGSYSNQTYNATRCVKSY